MVEPFTPLAHPPFMARVRTLVWVPKPFWLSTGEAGDLPLAQRMKWAGSPLPPSVAHASTSANSAGTDHDPSTRQPFLIYWNGDFVWEKQRPSPHSHIWHNRSHQQHCSLMPAESPDQYFQPYIFVLDATHVHVT